MTAPRALIWTSSYQPQIGGLAVEVTHLVKALRARGVSTAVVTDSYNCRNQRECNDHAKILRVPMLSTAASRDPALMLELISRVRTFVSNFRPNLLHLHSLGADSLFFDLMSRGLSQPLVVTRHEHFPSETDVSPGSAVHRILERARFVVAPTQAVIDDVLRAVPDLPQERLPLVPNGISGSELGLEQTPTEASFEPLRFLFVGRLVEQKGVDVALRAFASCREPLAGIGQEPTLRIVGDGPKRGALEQLAAELGLGNVEFVGAVPPSTVGREFASASIVLMPSRSAEGFGRIAAEAALAKRPVVASSVAGLAEVVVDGETGLLVEPESVEALSHAMQHLARNRELALELASNAQARAKSQYTLAVCARSYNHLYRTMIEEKP